MIYCPICGKEMQPSGIGDLYSCPAKVVQIPGYGQRQVVDAAIHMRGNKKILQVIEVPPYLFTIIDSDELTQTKIAKLPDEPLAFQATSAIYKTILKIPAIVDLPWYDSDKVLERVKTYILFS